MEGVLEPVTKVVAVVVRISGESMGGEENVSRKKLRSTSVGPPRSRGSVLSSVGLEDGVMCTPAAAAATEKRSRSRAVRERVRRWVTVDVDDSGRGGSRAPMMWAGAGWAYVGVGRLLDGLEYRLPAARAGREGAGGGGDLGTGGMMMAPVREELLELDAKLRTEASGVGGAELNGFGMPPAPSPVILLREESAMKLRGLGLAGRPR